MKVKYDGKTYNFNLDDLTTKQARSLKQSFGLTIMGLEQGVKVGDPDALAAIYWIMLEQSGVTGVNPDDVDFKISPFMSALGKAWQEQQAVVKESPDPKAA